MRRVTRIWEKRCAVAVLPFQLAVGFRGVLSFWTAGEVFDRDLGPCAQSAAAAVLLGFADRKGRADLLARLDGGFLTSAKSNPAQ